MRHESDNPSIGLILCKDRKGLIAEYALKDISKPVGVSEYQLVACHPGKPERKPADHRGVGSGVFG